MEGMRITAENTLQETYNCMSKMHGCNKWKIAPVPLLHFEILSTYLLLHFLSLD